MSKSFIVIAGMHRSGTSFLARSLNLCGVYLGDLNSMSTHEKTGDKANLKGSWEHKTLKKIDDELFIQNKFGYKKIPNNIVIDKKSSSQLVELIKELMDNSEKISGFKDPLFLLFLNSLTDCLPEKTIVIGIFRHPLKVAESLKIRDNRTYDESLFWWQLHNMELLRALEKYGGFLLNFDWPAEKLLSEISHIVTYLGLQNHNLQNWYDKELLRSDNTFLINYPLSNELQILYSRLISRSLENKYDDINNNQEEKSKTMKFTGEQLIPNNDHLKFLYQEHIARYIFASSFIKDKIVLDAACGTGYGSSFLIEHGASKLFGIDNSYDAFQYCVENYSNPNLIFKHADCLNLPFTDSTFDCVVSFETIEHLENPEKFLSEIKRTLKKNGLFIVSTPNIESYEEENPFHVHEFSLKEFQSILCKNFKNVSILFQFYPSSIMIGNYDKINSFNTTVVDQNAVDETEPLYFIAICSDFELPLMLNNNFIFKDSNLITGKKSHLRELQTLNQINEQHIQNLRTTIKDKDKHLDQVIKDKDKHLDQVIKDKDKRLEQTIKDYQEQIFKIKNSKLWKLARTWDKLLKKS